VAYSIRRSLRIHEAHTSELWQIKFHPGHSDQHLFTCGEDGRLLHWDTNARRMQRPSSEFMVPEDTNNLAIHNLLSDDSSSLGINTIDCDVRLPASVTPLCPAMLPKSSATATAFASQVASS